MHVIWLDWGKKWVLWYMIYHGVHGDSELHLYFIFILLLSSLFIYLFAGTDSNPYCLDALAVFMFRVLQRVNHPVYFVVLLLYIWFLVSNSNYLLLNLFVYFKGNLDKASPNAGYVLLMFYHLYDGKVYCFSHCCSIL